MVELLEYEFLLFVPKNVELLLFILICSVILSGVILELLCPWALWELDA